MGSRSVIILKLSPLIIPFTVIFTTGVFLTILQSMGFFIPVPIEGRLFEAYVGLFSGSWFYVNLGFSLYCAFVSALISVGLGTFLSYYIWRLPVHLQQIAVLSKIPLILPHIAVAFIVLMFFSNTGYLSSVLNRAGLIEDAAGFPSILFSGYGFGIILAYVYKETPFVMLLVSSVLKKFDQRQIETAKMLGASRGRVFFKIVFPFLLPVINTSFIILFLYAFGAFDIPFMLGESHPGMLSIQVYNLYFKRDLVNRPQAMAILVVMFAFSLVFIYLYSRIAQRIDVRFRKI
jgi:putative spermidine/putrescine transport system permease protein